MPPQNSEYQFIMDSTTGNAGGPAFLQDPKKRNIIAVLFVTVALLVVFIIIAIFMSFSGRSSSAIVDVAAYQTELLRISNLGLASATDPSVRAKAATMQAFIQSDLSNTTAYLASNGKSIEKTETALKLDTTIDKNLESAALRNRFEEELLKSLEATSKNYKSSLQVALNGSSNDEETAVLQSAAKNIITFEES
jgi:hypothetical protein